MHLRMISAGKCLFCLAAVVVANGFSVSSLATDFPVWDNSTVEVKEGDDLSLSCKVSGLGNIDVVRIVHNTSKQAITVTDNANVKLPFRGLPRYKVHYRLSGNVGTVQLQIRDIRSSDSGSFGCYKLSDDTKIAYADVKVLASVEKFFIVYALENGVEKNMTGDDELEAVVNEGDVARVGCVATINSGSVEPQLDLAIDDESRTAEAVLIKSITSETSDDDLVLYNTQVKLLLALGRVGRAQSRKRIKCTARAKGYEDRTESAVLKVRYSPVILCFETSYKRQPGTSVTFTCNVHSNPNVMINWHRADQKAVESASVKEKVLDEESVQVNLTIAELENSDFTSYTLTANNSIGQATEILTVERDSGTEKEGRLDRQATYETSAETVGELDFSVAEDFDETTYEKNTISDNKPAVKEAIHGPDQSVGAVADSSIAVLHWSAPRVTLVLGLSVGAKWLREFV